MRKEDKGGGTMERLTNIGSNGEIWITDNDETRRLGRKETAYKKLAEYEDLEEQGLLLRLPCKVGDKAWYVNRDGINEVIVDSFVFNVNLFANVSVYIGAERFGKTLTPYKTLFFSKEEAEQKLKEMESD